MPFKLNGKYANVMHGLVMVVMMTTPPHPLISQQMNNLSCIRAVYEKGTVSGYCDEANTYISRS
jgi:hypothetical protein